MNYLLDFVDVVCMIICEFLQLDFIYNDMLFSRCSFNFK